MYLASKRIIDVAVATCGLVVAAPLLAAIAVAIAISSGAPIFYRANRVGRRGRPFRMWKFRTMVVNADRIGGPSTANGDPRVTPVGRWLRRHHLDELPQFVNVLTGEMSLVGPRPEVQQYVDMMTQDERAILDVKPGITDWATLWNPDEGAVLAGADDPERVYMEKIRPKKIRWQLEYVRRRSLAVDLIILASTIAAVVTHRRPRALEVISAPRNG